MKKFVILGIVVTLLVFGLALQMAAPTMAGKPDGCTTIQDGTLVDSNNEPLVLGFDKYGYNYQSHMFNGRYCDNDRVIGGAYCDVNLIMKWSDTWLSNKDCNGDGNLDRGYKCDPENAISSACEGAWLTNHQWGLNDDGDKWTYFVKIVAVPTDAELLDGIWYTADETEIGPVIWGAYARILQVSNDKAYEEHGVLYKSPASPGFGVYK